MKTRLFYFLPAILLTLLSACKKQEDLKPTGPILIQLNERGKQLVGSSSDFGIDLFKATLNSETGDNNLMISPYSISLALAMTYNGAGGDTNADMEYAMRLNGMSTENININFKQITDALLSLDPTVSLSIANSIWYNNTFSVLAPFIDVNQNFYNAQVTSLDFSSPSAANTINTWVAANTHNKIPTIVEEIDPETVMFLINAIYFKGAWKYKFDSSNNFNSIFHLSDGTTKQVEMMTQKADIAQYQNGMFLMAEMLYGQGNWAMDLILPRDNYTVDDVASQMSGLTWNLWISLLSTPYSCQISLPPFKFEYSNNLNDILTELGMGVAFDADNADFSNINSDAQLYISKVLHKTFVEVNEEGTEAAAVTSVEVGTTSAPPLFILNKPFIFVIREVSTGTILFIGKVENPER